MGKDCPRCLRWLAKLTVDLASHDPNLKKEMMRMAEEIISSYPPSSVPSDVSNEFLKMIYRVSRNPDPFRERKIEEMKRAKEIVAKFGELRDLKKLVEVAAIGNSLDFFLPVSSLERAVIEKIEFALDDRDELERRLEKANKVLYIADNAGEVFFDIPFLKFLSERAHVYYAVKEKPIQNDLSMIDLKGVEIPAEVIPSSPTVGVYLSLAKDSFKQAFNSADIIISKGMGNYETLSELDLGNRCFYILRAKCRPVAESLGVEKGSYVAAFV
ncbi:MAG: ARMT1-like domain-containing protein [Candidatus Hadarchaeales archaeon]